MLLHSPTDRSLTVTVDLPVQTSHRDTRHAAGHCSGGFGRPGGERAALLLHEIRLDRSRPAEPRGPGAVGHLDQHTGRVGPWPQGAAGLVGAIDAAALTGRGGVHRPVAAAWRTAVRARRAVQGVLEQRAEPGRDELRVEIVNRPGHDLVGDPSAIGRAVTDGPAPPTASRRHDPACTSLAAVDLRAAGKSAGAGNGAPLPHGACGGAETAAHLARIGARRRTIAVSEVAA